MKNLLVILAVLLLSQSVFALTPITGTLGACVGATSSLSDTTSGGTWTSSNTFVATVGSTGIVTGVAAGTATITYTLGTFVTATFVVNAAPAAITGPPSVCPTATITLSDATTGGTWSSDETYYATVVATTGVVTGVAHGTAIIVYSLGTGCSVNYNVTVESSGADSVTGASSVCSGSTITLSDTAGGGAWSSSNTSVATVSGSGVVLGVASGTVEISYTVSGTCGTAAAYKVITVNATSSAGTITGASSVNVSLTTTLSDAVTGGTWSSSNTSIATVNASTGVVTGVAAGSATITYTVTGCTGTVYTTFPLSVTTIDGISGNVIFSGARYYGNVRVWLISFNTSTLMLEAIDSTTVSCSGADSVYYQFTGVATDSFRIKAAQIDSLTGSGYIPTYHTSSFYWHDATVLYHTSGTEDIYQDINMAYGTVTPGPGFIGGNVTLGANRATSGTAPSVGLTILLIDPSSGNVLEQTLTDGSGNYTFSGLALGSYTVYPELINYATASYNVTLSTTTSSVSGANFVQHTVSRSITPGTAGIAGIGSGISTIITYPNPTNGILNIQWQEAATETGNLTITDITGREVFKSSVNMTSGRGNTHIDLSGFNSGLYIISIKSGDINYNNKLQIVN